MTKRTTKSKIALSVMTGAMVASAFAPSMNVHASDFSKTVKNVKNMTPATSEGFTSPNEPIVLNLDTEKGLKANEKVGVLISDGTNAFFADKENGQLLLSENGTNVTLTANHPDFERFTGYSVKVLIGSEYNKYKASIKSGGKAESFAKTQAPNQSALNVEIKTGSAIGEAQNVSTTIEDNEVSVTEGGKLTVMTTDSYGNPATDATLTVTGKGEGNQRVASTFTTTETTPIRNGLVDLTLEDHSANNVELSYSVKDNKYGEVGSTFGGTETIEFLPGNAETAKVTLPSSMKIGENVAVSGELLDVYGNGVTEEVVEFSGALAGSVSTDVNGNLDGTIKVVSSGTVTTTVDGNPVDLMTPSGTPITTITATSSGIDPATSKVRTTSSGIQYSNDGGQTWKSVTIASNIQGVVYDSHNKVWVALRDYQYYGNYGLYKFGYLYTSEDGLNWKYSTKIQVDFNAIAVDDKGHVVIGGGYSGTYGITTKIYTSTNGGKSFSQTHDSYKSYRGGYGPGKGMITSMTWDGTQFKAVGTFRSSTYHAYSSDGMSWR